MRPILLRSIAAVAMAAISAFAMSAIIPVGAQEDPDAPSTSAPLPEPPVHAAQTAEPIHTISAGGGACSLNLGVAFDGSRLLVSCESDNRIDAVSPQDGALIQTYNIAGLSALGAIAFDGPRGLLYGCDSEAVVAIDLGAGTFAPMFPTDGCRDGLAYDGVDDTFWASGDVDNTITHYTYSGSVIGTHDFNGEIGPGNSGIAVGGAILYLANNGGQQIYQSDKAFTNVELFAELTTRLEDMECDNVTFAAEGIDALWVIDAFDRTVNAFEIPVGSCGFGGVPPAGPPTPAAAPEQILLEPTFTG